MAEHLVPRVVAPRHNLIHVFDRIFTLNYMQHFPELNIHLCQEHVFYLYTSESNTAVKVKLLHGVAGIEGSL